MTTRRPTSVTATLACVSAIMSTVPIGCRTPERGASAAQVQTMVTMMHKVQDRRTRCRWLDLIACAEDVREAQEGAAMEPYPTDWGCADAYFALRKYEEALACADRSLRATENYVQSATEQARRSWDGTQVDVGFSPVAMIGGMLVKARREHFFVDLRARAALRDAGTVRSLLRSGRDTRGGEPGEWLAFADAYALCGRWQEAKKCATNAVEGAKAAPMAVVVMTQEQMTNAVFASFQDGDRERSDTGFSHAPANAVLAGDSDPERIAIMEKANREQSKWQQAAGFCLLGQAEYHLGRYVQAEEALGVGARLMARTRNVYGEAPHTRWQCPWYAARVKEALGKTDEALAPYQECLDVLRTWRRTARSGAARTALGRMHQEVFASAVQFLMTNGRVGDALCATEQARARSQLDSQIGKAIARTAQEREALRQFLLAWERADAIVLAQDATPREAARAARDMERAKAYLCSLSPELGRRWSCGQIELARIQTVLPPRTRILAYFETGDAMYGWVVGKETVMGKRLMPITPEMRERAAEYVRATSVHKEELLSTSAVTAFAADFRKWLIDPVAAAIDGDLLYVVRHGVVSRLRFDGLLAGTQVGSGERKIVYAPSVSAICLSLTPATARSPSGGPVKQSP